MVTTLRLSVTEFKQRCHALLSDLQNRKIKSVIVTKRGKPIAEISATDEAIPSLFGCLKGRVTIPEGLDLSKIDIEEPWDAETGG